MVIGFVLIIAIIALTIALTGAAGAPPLTGDGLEDISNEKPKPDDAQKDPTPEPITYVPSFPKQSQTSDTYLFTQSLCGVGNIKLKAIHQTTVGLYTVVESDCTIGDVAADKPTVGVAKSDVLGNIEGSLSIPSTMPSYFVASQITPLGLVVICTNQNKNYLYVNVIDYNFTDVKTQLISYADKAFVYPTDDSFIILADVGNESLIYNYSDGQFDFQSMPACDLVQIFEYGDFFTVIYNTDSGYSLCELNKSNFNVRKEISVSSSKLINVFPLIENGEQIFVALEYDGALYAKKYDKNFASDTPRKKMGAYDVIGTGTDGAKIYLAVRGNMNGIITLNSDLSSSFSTNDASFLAAKIHDFTFLNGKFYILASDANNNLAFLTVDRDTTSASYFPATKNNAYFAVNPNGTFILAYDGAFYDYNAVEYIGLQ